MNRDNKEFVGLMIANTEVNLLTCIQIRRRLFPNKRMDIILGNQRVKTAYDKGKLQLFFDNVYFYNYEEYQYSILRFGSSRQNLRNVVGIDIAEYTEIFFWNPDCFIYNIFHYDISKKIKYHIYSDSVGIFLDTPRFAPIYGGVIGGLLNYCDRKFYKWGRLNRIEYDIYSFRGDLIDKGKYGRTEIIEIPQCTSEDVNAFNLAYDYIRKENDVECIFLDVAHNGEYDDADLMNTLKKLMRDETKVNVVIKPHPGKIRQGYVDQGYELLDIDIPWELFCLNEDMNKLILLGVYGGALIQTYIMSGKRLNAILLDNIIPSHFIYLKEIKALFEKINDETNSMIEVESLSEMEEDIQILLDKKCRKDDKEITKQYY